MTELLLVLVTVGIIVAVSVPRERKSNTTDLDWYLLFLNNDVQGVYDFKKLQDPCIGAQNTIGGWGVGGRRREEGGRGGGGACLIFTSDLQKLVGTFWDFLSAHTNRTRYTSTCTCICGVWIIHNMANNCVIRTTRYSTCRLVLLTTWLI